MSENKQSDWKEREVGALWKQEGKKSNYCTGYIVSDELGNKVRQRVIMFANKNKSNEKSPDFILYISKDMENNNSKEPHEMVTKGQAKALKKEGYKLIGAHSAVKLCCWTKHQLRG